MQPQELELPRAPGMPYHVAERILERRAIGKWPRIPRALRHPRRLLVDRTEATDERRTVHRIHFSDRQRTGFHAGVLPRG